MTFVDTNVFVYAVGREHPLREEARRLLGRAVEEQTPLATSAEVLQELLHLYLPVRRMDTLDRALELVARSAREIWSMEAEDVRLTRSLADRYPGLSARDLLHLACCVRHDARGVMTFDRGLAAAFAG